MFQKIRFLLVFGLVVCIICLLSIFFVPANSEKVNQSESYFNLSIEELMEIEVTTAIPQKENNA